MGANSFLLEQTPFRRGLDVQESKHKITKIVSLVNVMESYPGKVPLLLLLIMWTNCQYQHS